MRSRGRLLMSKEPSLRGLLAYFIRLGTVGFGGPIALASRMNKDLVDERGWLSKQDYLEGLAFSQLPPARWRRNLRCISAG